MKGSFDHCNENRVLYIVGKLWDGCTTGGF
jgi:hypothetical protein